MRQRQLMTTGEVARMAGKDPGTVRFWERDGKLPAVAKTLTGRRLFDEQDVREFLQHRHTEKR